MSTRPLGSSQLEVSVVGLGCNNFGGRIGEEASRAVIDAALDAGVTFFDTADVYGNRGGSDEIICRALSGRRDRVVLATKFGHDLGDGETARGARPYIRKAVEASLRLLELHGGDGRGGTRDRGRARPDALRHRAKRVLVARPRGRRGAAARVRAP